MMITIEGVEVRFVSNEIPGEAILKALPSGAIPMTIKVRVPAGDLDRLERLFQDAPRVAHMPCDRCQSLQTAMSELRRLETALDSANAERHRLQGLLDAKGREA